MDVKKKARHVERDVTVYMNCANTNINQTTTKINDINASIEETLQEDPPHNIDEIMEWMFGEDGEEVEDECDEESDIEQN